MHPGSTRRLMQVLCLWGPGVAAGLCGCGTVPAPTLPDENISPVDSDRYRLLARFAHISDAHVVDEESPGRLALFAGLTQSAWRPQEAYSAQVLDGTVRAVNKLHVSGESIDFLIHTGDAVDNAQLNELRWFVGVLEGSVIDPLSGVDDRPAETRPEPLLDPHAPFFAQGLYRRGVHGDAPTIPWYSVVGNHDRFALGILPIVRGVAGVRVAPVPLQPRIGLFAPTHLNPTGGLSWAPISPANPGPPRGLSVPRPVVPNPERRFINDAQFIEAHLTGTGQPAGHGFDPVQPASETRGRDRTWYSASPVPGLRLIVLNSATPRLEQPRLIYVEGAISRSQRTFLESELAAAAAAGDVVIVATHHPSGALDPALGTSLTPRGFRDLLRRHPCVKLHIAGHWHSEHVFDRAKPGLSRLCRRGGYVEIVTGSLIDAPQRGRIIEVWQRDEASGTEPDGVGSDVELRYRFFAHYDEIEPVDDTHAELFLDPLAELRRVAARLAGAIASGANDGTVPAGSAGASGRSDAR